MHRFLIYPIAASLWLASCAGIGNQDWQTYLDAGHTFYAGFCVTQPQSSYCTADARKKATDAYKAAEKAIVAYNAGTGDLKAVQKAVKAAFKLFADFQG